MQSSRVHSTSVYCPPFLHPLSRPPPLIRFAGFDGNYDNYPTPAEAAVFVRAYMAAERDCEESAVPDADVDRAVIEADLFALASHQYWGAWCFLQAQWSKLDFDYIEYARVRWGESARRHKAVVEAARRAFL